MNTYISNNLSALTNFSSAFNGTASSTNNLVYGDIGAAGPAVTITTGTQALVGLGAEIVNTSVNDGAAMSFNVTGATTLNASSMEASGWALYEYGTTASFTAQIQCVFLVTGLTAGSNTVTSKYRAVVGGVAQFTKRNIWAWALPST